MNAAKQASIEQKEAVVLLASAHLEDQLAEEIAKACAKAGLKARAWSGATHEEERLPSLLVASLPRGARRIADDLVASLNHSPRRSLLLLSAEPLVRPAVSLHEGRVLLLGPPHTATRIASRLRLQFAEHHGVSGADTMHGLPTSLSPVVSRSLQRTRWWVGVAASRASGPAHEEDLPALQDHIANGVTIALPGPAVAQVGLRELAQIAQCLQIEDDREAGGKLLKVMGPGLGVLHLSTARDRWRIYWPDTSWPLWLCSPLRLPQWAPLTAVFEVKNEVLHSFDAHSGDLLAAMTALPLQPSPKSVRPLSRRPPKSLRIPPLSVRRGIEAREIELLAALAEGGMAAQEFIETKLREQPIQFASGLIEVQ